MTNPYNLPLDPVDLSDLPPYQKLIFLILSLAVRDGYATITLKRTKGNRRLLLTGNEHKMVSPPLNLFPDIAKTWRQLARISAEDKTSAFTFTYHETGTEKTCCTLIEHGHPYDSPKNLESLVTALRTQAERDRQERLKIDKKSRESKFQITLTAALITIAIIASIVLAIAFI